MGPSPAACSVLLRDHTPQKASFARFTHGVQNTVMSNSPCRSSISFVECLFLWFFSLSALLESPLAGAKITGHGAHTPAGGAQFHLFGPGGCSMPTAANVLKHARNSTYQQVDALFAFTVVYHFHQTKRNPCFLIGFADDSITFEWRPTLFAWQPASQCPAVRFFWMLKE